MRADEIPEILEDFINEKSPYKCILLNGSWGIGKTYQIKKSIEKNENIIYLSVFGVAKIETIYTDIIFQSDSDKEKGLKSKIINIFKSFNFKDMSPYISMLNSKKIFEMLVGLKKYRDKVVIIDDLERLCDSLNLKEILGLIEYIKSLDIKIVIVANKEELNDGNKEILNSYSEKIIDREFLIDKVADNLMNENNVMDLDIVNDFITNHEIKNIRTLEKAEFLFKDVYNKIACITTDDIKSELRYVCYAIVCEHIDETYLKKREKQQEVEGKDKMEAIFDSIYNELGMRVKNYYLLNHNFPSEIIDSIINYYISNNSLNIDILKEQYNEYKKQKEERIYYKSEEEAKKIIAQLENEFINNEVLEISEIIIKANTIICWKKILCEDFSTFINIIEGKIKKSIDYNIKTNDLIYNQLIDNFNYNIEEIELVNLVERTNNYLIDKYFLNNFAEINEMLKKNQYELIYERFKLIENIYIQYKDILRTHLDSLLIEFLLPKNHVSELQLRCWNKIIKIINAVDKVKLQSIVEHAVEEYGYDKMFIHRLRQSVEKYGIKVEVKVQKKIESDI